MSLKLIRLTGDRMDLQMRRLLITSQYRWTGRWHVSNAPIVDMHFSPGRKLCVARVRKFDMPYCYPTNQRNNKLHLPYRAVRLWRMSASGIPEIVAEHVKFMCGQDTFNATHTNGKFDEQDACIKCWAVKKQQQKVR